jgi:hypothetical protein
MRTFPRALLLLLPLPALLAGVSPHAGTDPAAGTWVRLDAGIELGTFDSPLASDSGDSRIRILRIDPKSCRLRLLNASAPGEKGPLTAREWCERHGLLAAINASMYQEDLRTSVSLMKTRGYTNNARVSKDMTILAFDRLDTEVPEIQIIDRECQDLDAVRARYGTLVQSIRMISCTGRNVWSQQPRRSSIAAIGVDGGGRILFLHSRSPYSTHDFISILLGLPVGLSRAMYVEGGPEAQLYARGGGREFEFVGSFEAGFIPRDDSPRAWRVPNVIAVEKRPLEEP